MKGLFGAGKPPPPAGASLAGAPSADPLASLFASDTIVKAPGIHDAPSEAELGRWRATMQSSLFEERVVDPAPSPPPPAATLDLAAPEPPRAASPRQAPPPPAPPTPPARGAAMFEDDEVEMAPAAGDVDEPIVQLPAAKSRSTKSTGKRRRAAAAAAQAPTEEPPAPARRRRFERGPSKSTLVALGIAAVGAIAALVIVLGPSGSSGTVVAPPVAPAPPAAAAPAAAPVVAAAAPAQEAETPAETAKAAAAAKAPAAAAPEQPAPAETAQPAAAPAKTAAAAEAAEDDEEGAPEGLLRASRQALAADDPEGAERIAREALAKAPQDHHAMEALVLALMDQDRGKDALPFARRMVQKRSRRVPYRLLLGDLLLMVGDDAAARAEWQKALALSPGDKAIKRRLGL